MDRLEGAAQGFCRRSARRTTMLPQRWIVERTHKKAFEVASQTTVTTNPCERELGARGRWPPLSECTIYSDPAQACLFCQCIAAAVDVSIFPSVARSEAFGIVQIEAMAAGLPVVNTALSSGVPWVSLDGITGLTVEPNDATALEGAVTRLLQDDALRTRLGTAARQRAIELFTTQRMVAETLDLYRTLARGSIPPPMAARTA